MKVKVIKANMYTYWYADKIGQVFDVRESAYNYVCNDTEHAFDKDDVEVIEESKMNTFTKSNLKTGMRILTESGTEYMVFLDAAHSYGLGGKDCVVSIVKGDTTWNPLHYIDDSEIIEVKQAAHPFDFLWDWEGYETIWKREEKTPEQIQLDKVMDQIAELQKQAQELQELINK